MYKNELAIVSIKPNLAYGELGRKPDIPPNSRITYLFGLLHFEKQKEISEMTWAQVNIIGRGTGKHLGPRVTIPNINFHPESAQRATTRRNAVLGASKVM